MFRGESVIKRILLDTSVGVALLRGRDPRVGRHLAALDGATDLVLSSLVAAELSQGIYLAGRQQAERARLNEFRVGLSHHEFGFDAADQYGRISAELRRHGQSAGSLDELIAAQALSLGASVATLNVKDFIRIPGLTVHDWSVAA